MAESPKNGTAVKAKSLPPTAAEADLFARSVKALVSADFGIAAAIEADIERGEYDSPFVHPLYAVRTKLDSVRGRQAKKLAAYARSIKPKKAAKK